MRGYTSFSVTKALSAAFSGLPAAWRGAGLALSLLWAVAAGAPFVLSHFPLPWVGVMLTFAVLLLKLMSLGGLYRVALFAKDARHEGLGFGGVQLGRPELRLTIASLVAGLFMMMVAIAAFIVLAIVLKMYDVDWHHGAVWLAGGIVATWLLLFFVALKFSLMHAANVAQRRLMTLNALGLTSGQVGKLFLGVVSLSLPVFVVCALMGGAVSWQFAPEIRLAHALPYAWMNQRMTLAAHAGVLFVAIFFLMPLLTGFFASAYRQTERLRAL